MAYLGWAAAVVLALAFVKREFFSADTAKVEQKVSGPAQTVSGSSQTLAFPPFASWRPSFLSLIPGETGKQARLVEDGTLSWRNIETSTPADPSRPVQMAVLLRPDAERNARIFVYSGASRIICYLDPKTGIANSVMVSSATGAECRGEALKDGWWRLSLSGSLSSHDPQAVVTAAIAMASRSSEESYPGDGVSGMDIALP